MFVKTKSYSIQTENTETFIRDWWKGGGVKAFHRNLNPEIARYWKPALKKAASSPADSSNRVKQRWSLSICTCCQGLLPRRQEHLAFTD